MADADKRLRYFNGQLLEQEDFRDEQAYHLDRLRRHNRQLHTPGIAAGLTVDAPIGAAEATVEPGTALDAEGRQIVLAAPRAVPLAGHAAETVLVVISYAEEAADPAGLGAGTETRWHEKPAVEAVAEAGAPGPDTHVRLARLTVASDGTVAAAPDLEVRAAAGAVAAGGAAVNAHVADAENPHGVTAAQTGALASVDGVASPGGDVDLVAAGAITLQPDDGQKKITIGESHSERSDNPHAVTAAQVGAVPASGGIIDGDLQVGATSTNSRRLTLYGPTNSSSTDGALIVRSGSSSTYMKFDQNEVDCTNTFYLNFYSGNPVRIGSFGKTGGLYVYGDIHATGDVSAGGTKSGYVSDAFRNGAEEPLEKGDVVVLADSGVAAHHGRGDDIPAPEVVRAGTDHDPRVCGIVAELLVEDEPEAPESEREEKEQKGEKIDDGIKRLQVIPRGQRDKLDRTKVGSGEYGRMVTLGCFAVCKADADVAPIGVGDLLTTSPTPGHAQKVTDPSRALGALLGKALAPLARGKGTIPVLVLLH